MRRLKRVGPNCMRRLKSRWSLRFVAPSEHFPSFLTDLELAVKIIIGKLKNVTFCSNALSFKI